MSQSSSLAERLERFYQHYAPEKLVNIPKLCETYKGMETKLFDELVKRYGPEPPLTTNRVASSNALPGASSSPTTTTSSPPPASQDETAAVRLRLQQFYERHAPDKVGNIDTVLNFYKGNHDQMFRDLAAKYETGAAASPPAAAAPAAVTTAAASANADVYRARVKRFYEHYAPDKVGNINTVLQHYSGKEEIMMKELVAKYGPEPVPGAEAPNVSAAYRQRLTRFLAKYSPDKVSQVDALLQKFAGKEDELFKGLVAKFGPEPSGPDEPGSSAAAGASAVSPAAYRTRVEQILLRYAPDKVSSAPSMLHKYQGRENELIQALVAKFGPEPPAPSSAPSSSPPGALAAEPGSAPGERNQPDTMSPAARLTRFMTHYAPERVSQVPAMLQKYQGRETEMFHALTSKFGPEPATPHQSLGKPEDADGAQPSIPEPKSFEEMYRRWIGEKAFDVLLQHPSQLFAADESVKERRCLLALCLECFDALTGRQTKGPADDPRPKDEDEEDAAAVVGLKQFNVMRTLVEGSASARDASSAAAAVVALRPAPSFVDTQLVAETVQLAKKVRALSAEVIHAVDETEKVAEQQGNELLRWEAEDKERVLRLARERAARRCAVISRAVEMIGEVEDEMRLELWRVQELEARGRFLWFQDRRRELQLLAKPASLSVLERKFERWKELVKEQQDVVLHVERARHHFHGAGEVDHSPMAAVSAAKMRPTSTGQMGSASTTPRGERYRNASGGRQDKHLLLPQSEQRRVADRDVGQTTPQGTPRSMGWASGSGRTPRGLSPALRAATPTRSHPVDGTRSPRNLFRSTSPSNGGNRNSMPYWGQYTPQRALHQHPSKAAVTPSASLPKKFKIPTTVPEPFQLSDHKRRAGLDT